MAKARTVIMTVGYQYSGLGEVDNAITQLIDTHAYQVANACVVPETLRTMQDNINDAHKSAGIDPNESIVAEIQYIPVHVIRNPLMIAAEAIRSKYVPGVKSIGEMGYIQRGIPWNRFVDKWNSWNEGTVPPLFWENFLDDPITNIMRLMRRIGVEFTITSQNTEKITRKVERLQTHEQEILRIRNEIFSLEEDRKAFAPQVDPWIVNHGYEFSSNWWKKEYWDSEESHAIIP